MREINIELEQTTTIAVNVAIDECYAQVSLEQMIDNAFDKETLESARKS